MATAPTPGGTSARSRKFRITLSGETLELDFAAVGPADDIVSRKETGFPVTGFLEEETIGADSLLILWWMARRKSGEPGLRFAKVLEQFPSYDSINAASPELTFVEDEAPEA